MKGVEDGQPLNRYVSAGQLKKYVEENGSLAVGDNKVITDNLTLYRVDKKEKVK